MTKSEKLDNLLLELQYAKTNNRNPEQPGSGYNFNQFCQRSKIEQGEGNILKEILISDGYIKYPTSGFDFIIQITSKGINFINKGGYKKLDEENIKKQKKEGLENQLIKSSLTINKWTKFGIAASILISIFAVIVSILAFFKD